MMRYSPPLFGVILCSIFFVHVEGFWRMVCGTIQTGRIDPIVSPGALSGHCHTVAGPINFNTTSTFASLQASYCTSCEIQQDKSAYWTPQLYYRHRNGSYEYTPHDGTVVYYLGRGTNASNIIPFPPGLRMLSGDSGVRAFDATTMTYENSEPIANRVSFACLDISGPMPETPYLARVNCSSGLRAQIQFQSCWDGINLYKTDQSHVAYLSQIDNGDCPPGYPYLFPHLFFEIIYAVNNINQTDGGYFVFSNGDTTGFGFHGDFLNGWDEGVLQAAVTQCINTADGSINDCPPLAASEDPYFNINCPEQPPIVNETVKGLLTALPGCNPPTGGPLRAGQSICQVKPSLNYVPNLDNYTRVNFKPGQLLGNWSYLGCSTDNTTVHALSGSSYTSTTAMTIEACTAFCHANTFLLAGLEYATGCYCGDSLPATQPILEPVTCSEKSYMVCSGNGLEFCGGPSLMQVWQDTQYAGQPITGPPTVGTSNKTLSNGAVATYAGCHSEPPGSRALTGASYSNSTGMTIKSCGLYCSAQGYLYFGTEYSSQCYCGNTIGGGVAAEASCSFSCTGNRAEFCGAGSIISVWSLGGTINAPSGTGTGSGPSTAAPVPGPTSTVVAATTYLGCHLETNPRALGTTGFSNNSVTNGLCAQYAQSLNLRYFYTEYYSQCYAGNVLNSGSTAIAESQCNTPCTGGAVQTCGGANAISLYQNNLYVPPVNPNPVTATGQTVQFRYLGCFTEGTNARALGATAQFSATSTTSGSLSVEICAAYCLSKGPAYTYMGVENAQECYCNGAGVINGATLSTGCTDTCTGNATEYCGGSSRINIYQRM